MTYRNGGPGRIVRMQIDVCCTNRVGIARRNGNPAVNDGHNEDDCCLSRVMEG